MVQKLSGNRRLLIALIVILALVQVAIGSYLYGLLCPPTPETATVEEGYIERQQQSAPGGTAGLRPSAVPAAGSQEGETIHEGPVLGEVEQLVVGPLVPATDVAGLARAFDEEQALDHISYLASDELNGRQPGTPGGRAAGDYVAHHFAAYGLEPAGIDGTYFQTFTVPYGRITSLPVLTVISAGGEALPVTYDYRTDYRALTGGYLGAGEGEGPVVWLNECLHGDYDGLDMVGKIALCRFISDPAVYREAIEHRVGGLLLLDREREGEPFRRGGYNDTAWVPETVPAYLISDTVARDLLTGTDYTLDELSLRFSATSLSTTVRMVVTTEEQDEIAARNVLGLLPGADPAHDNEVVVIGAHYDHLGPEPGGAIMNGANDNASGVATLLEIARVWQAGSFRPARSVLFASWDGEEQGLLGSRHYVDHPTQPVTETVAMLNLDMVGTGQMLQIDGEGPVAAQLEVGAVAYGVTYTSTFHGRSDHLPFAAVGVPAAMLIWWPDDFYHTVNDDTANIEPSKLKAVGVLSAHTLAALADGEVGLERAVDRLEASVADRDRDAFLAMLDPTDRDWAASQAAWFDNVWSRGLSDISIEPDQVHIGDGEAQVTLRVAFHWADEEVREPSVSLTGHFTLREDTWCFAGYDLDESAGEVVTVYRLGGTSIGPGGLLSATHQAYVSVAADLGVEPITGTRFVAYPDAETLGTVARPAAREDVAWLVSSAGLAHVVSGIPITPVVVSLVLNQMGLPADEGEWLREGLTARYEADVSSYLPALVSEEPSVSLLASRGSMGAPPDTAEEGAGGFVMRAYAWSLTDYLLEHYGTDGLRALCAAWGRDGQAAAFEEGLGLSADRIEAAWRAARIRPLRAVAAGIQATIADRQRAFVEKDEAGFLSTVVLSDPILRAEERHWLVTLTNRPEESRALSYTVEAELVGWMPGEDEARVALRTRTDLSDGVSYRASHNARFVREVGRWRYAGLDWTEFTSEHFVLKLERPDLIWAKILLDHAEAAYSQVTGDLSVGLPLPLQIKVYEDAETFQESVASLLPGDPDTWTADGMSIKLRLDPGTGSAMEAIARGLAHHALSVEGVETAWIREGVAAHEADQVLPLGTHRGSALRQRIVREALGSHRTLGWDELVSLEDLSTGDLELARAQSWSLVVGIVDGFGLSGLRRCIAEAARGEDTASILWNALRWDADEFLAEWREAEQSMRGPYGAPVHLAGLAGLFDRDRALGHVALLASPELGGRQAGDLGADRAAAYIAEQFSMAGLEPLVASSMSTSTLRDTPLGPVSSLSQTLTVTGTDAFLQWFPISYTHLLTVPTLALLDADGGESHRFAYREDFVEVAGRGSVEGQLVWVSATDLAGLRFDGAVVVERGVSNLIERAVELREHGAGGLLVVTDRDPEELRTSRGAIQSLPESYMVREGVAADGLPVFELTESALEPLLERSSVAAEDLYSPPPALPLDIRVRMDLPRAALTTTQTANVLGFLPGTDPRLAHEVLVVGAHYDHIGRLLGGAYFPGANQNASGVAAMLELARVWEIAGYQPGRSVLFAAWGAEERGSAGVDYYLSDPVVPLTRTVGVIALDSIADGEGYRLWVRGGADRDLPLTHRLQVSASQLGRQVWRKGATNEGWHALFSSQAVPTVKLTWAEAEGLAYRLTDTADAIDPDRLANSGEILTLALAWLAGR